MLCAISGEAPQTPVASKKSGLIFEKRLIEAYIAENGKDPVTNEDLSLEDLVDLQTDRTVKPRPPQLTSIPGLLKAFQNEWDALALERFEIQQELERTRRDLSRALYENDAALRVIARVQKERDEARDTLSKLSINGTAGTDGSMLVDSQSLPTELTAAVTQTQESLSKTRRKRPVPADWVDAEGIGAFKAQKLDQAGAPTSRFISQHPDKKRLLHAAGQMPGSIALFDMENSVATSLDTTQDGALTDAVWTTQGSIVAGSATGYICLRGVGNSPAFVRQSHKAEVTSVSVHASGRLLASTSLDSTFVFYDASSGTPVSQIRTEAPLTTGEFHPDGHLYSVGGVDGEIKLYETASGTRAATFTLEGPVKALSFSENGTWLAASVKDKNMIEIWNLRTMSKIHTLDTEKAVNDLAWDYTGQFLAAATSSGVVVHQYSKASKAWTETLVAGTPAAALAWGPSGKSLSYVDLEGGVNELS